MNIVARDESNSANSEPKYDQRNDEQILGRDKGHQNKLIEKAQDKLLESVGQNANGLFHEFLVATQWVSGSGKQTSEHYLNQANDQRNQRISLKLKSVNEPVW